MRHKFVTALLASASVLALTVAAAQPTVAGGFGVREQSAQFLGSAYAGSAAGAGLSSMFWNPAAAGQFNGMWSESHYAYAMSGAELSAGAGTTPALLGLNNTTDTSSDLLVSSSYVSYQVNSHLVFALSVTSPFGLATKPEDRDWVGREFGRTTKVQTYNFSPTLAYRVSPQFIVAAGLQIQNIDTAFKVAVAGLPGTPSRIIEGNDTALGFTLGVLWQPHEGTTLGLGWRSGIDHSAEGRIYVSGADATMGVSRAKTGFDTPDTVTLSARREINQRLTALGTVEWTRWSRFDGIDVVCVTASVVCPLGPSAFGLNVDWQNGWLFAAGLEYLYQPDIKLRAGLAYEISPVDDPAHRLIRIPDSDKIWVSVGASYRWSAMTSFDFAYAHAFGSQETFDLIESGQRLVGTMDPSADVFSVSWKTKFGGASPVEPLK